ncbi:S41 family peptidase [Butyrivibrio proteoclasticus]|uniref:S41 family peptidase n=1 Tax=Butyrivibrio proteoclasticus TaxID=43305 RepID=UPI000A9BE79E|nr:S41 family peptidase [Butyrivibrio proteoclasticus]
MQVPVEPVVDKEAEFKKKLTRRYLFGMLTGVLATIVLLAGVVIGFLFVGSRNGRVLQNTAQSSELLSDPVVQKLEKLNAIIDAYYYKTDVDYDQRADGLYKGLMESLGDPYSVYYTEEELIELRNDTQGIYYGIGAYVSMDTSLNLPRISGVMEGTPAEEAGLMANDIIYEINKESTAGLTLEEVVGKIKGEQGTTVHLTLVRDGEADYVELDVMRRQVEVPTVSTKLLDDGIGYIRITEFDTVTADQFKEGMAELRAHNIKGLILDLRGNPGGSLDTVVNIGDQLLPKGKIVYTKDRNGEGEEYYSSGEHELDIPLVVLVDQYSASASEILAGAIKDYQIGTLVGVTTYGKGIVQSILDLKDGTAVKLTVSSYYSPNGINIHGVGIEPDIVCEFDSEAYAADKTDSQLDKGIEVLKELIDN